MPADSSPRAAVSIGDYKAFRQNGFVIVRDLVSRSDVEEIRKHSEDFLENKLAEQAAGHPAGLTTFPKDIPLEQRAAALSRIHMLHRRVAMHERFLLHPRVLDVVEVLVGPDVLALQTMLFLNPPGTGGQGWHQDSYYIPTLPDTLIGAWLAVDDVDEYNGALWVAQGSQIEPVYPPPQDPACGDRHIADIPMVANASQPDEQNELTPIARGYPNLLAAMKAGDVVFFGGHTLHRSKRNMTNDRFRRAFVSHYCNARSFTHWGFNMPKSNPHHAPAFDPVTKMSNVSHILARGDTHLPFAQPRFNTPCAATLTAEQRRSSAAWLNIPAGESSTGMMTMTPAGDADHKH